jgi:hypothetical protein
MVHGVFDPQYQGYGEKFLVRSYLKDGEGTTADNTSHAPRAPVLAGRRLPAVGATTLASPKT